MNHARSLAPFALVTLAVVVIWTPGAAHADARAKQIRRSYTKYEARIPMRDGTKLFTAIYVPNARHAARGQRYPILLLRTPYGVGPYGADRYRSELGPSAAFEQKGYILVWQDVRGRYLSGGTFVNMRPMRKLSGAKIDESTDAYDTIAWLLKHVPGHNGRVGMVGISYPGFYASAGAIDGHPALKAVSPQAPIADWFFDDMHRNGAFVLPLAFTFLSSFGQPRPKPTALRSQRWDFGTADGYAFFRGIGPLRNVDQRYFQKKIPFWTTVTQHPNYDAFWRDRNILPRLRGVRAAVLVVGGWYDAEDLYGTLATYRALDKQNPRADCKLVMGPWYHGGWQRSAGRRLGDGDFGFATAEWYRDKVELPFFERHLRGGGKGGGRAGGRAGKGKRGKSPLPEALLFETGANRWRRFSAWPPKKTKLRALYFQPGEGLSWKVALKDGQTRFVSDPHKPVPYSQRIGTRWSRRYMVEDQRFAAWRPDVLVYRTAPLKDDVTIAGPLKAVLHVATDQSAADWIVKLVDEHPGKLEGQGPRKVSRHGGMQLLVRGDVIRGRFRESFAKPKAFAPNKPTKVAFTMQDVLHTFKRGHRIVVQVQSSWFPLIDRNPQRYVPNIFEAKASDFVRATHTVYHGMQRASRLEVRVLPQLGER